MGMFLAFVFKLLLILLTPVMILMGSILAFKFLLFGIKAKLDQVDREANPKEHHHAQQMPSGSPGTGAAESSYPSNPIIEASRQGARSPRSV